MSLVSYPAAVAEVLSAFQIAIELAFAALALRTAAGLLSNTDRLHRYLTLAMTSLALLILVSPIYGGGGPGGTVTTDLEIVLFLLSGYGLIMVRDSLVPFSATGRRLITGAVLVAGVAGIAVHLPAGMHGPYSLLQTLVLMAIAGLWALCIFEPIVTFSRLAMGQTAVAKARLQTLSAGYLGLLFVVGLGSLEGSVAPALSIAIDVLALAIVLTLYVAFFPPRWLRRLWREPEEDQLRMALHDLLTYSPDRATLAQRALVWAERLVGGQGGFVVDAANEILATQAISLDDARRISGALDLTRREGSVEGRQPWLDGSRIVVPLDLKPGPGAVVILAGQIIPMFGDDELNRLRLYATSIQAGLDRVAMMERITALEKAKSDFLSIASHELRGPMTVIKGYLTMIESGSLGDVSEKAQSVLPLLISKSDEVNWMIEQMIEASRLEEGRLALKKHCIDIVELTDDAIEGVRMLTNGHDLKVEQPDAPIETMVDPDRYQMVVRNLLSNAAKYSPAGTEITVTLNRNGENAYLNVTDHGIGIAPDDQARLFTRFSRARSSEHVQGTGLGLWLSREIARMHDGDLTVQSRPGQGSTFTLTVPLTK